MEAQLREQIRLSLLRYLDANAGNRFGMSNALLRQMLMADGMMASQAEVDAEMRYLADKGYVREQKKLLSPEQVAWEITADGRDFYARF